MWILASFANLYHASVDRIIVISKIPTLAFKQEMLSVLADSLDIYLHPHFHWSILVALWRSVSICLWKRWSFSHCFSMRISCPGMNKHALDQTLHINMWQFLSDDTYTKIVWWEGTYNSQTLWPLQGRSWYCATKTEIWNIIWKVKFC